MQRGMYSAMDDPMVLESRLPYPKTLDKTVLVARAKEIQEVLLPENGVHGHVVDVASGCMDDSEGGGTEDALFDTNHSTILDATSKHGDGAQDHGPSALTEPDGEGSLVDEQQREGSDSGCLLECAAATGQGAEGRARGEKTRKRRSKNWTDEETEILLKAVRQKRKIRSRLDRSSSDSEPCWEGVAKGMSGRSGYECRMRMETLTKACKAIKEYCDEQNLEFRQLNKVYEVMKRAHRKVATRFVESWYNQFRELFPLRSNKKRKEQGAGSPSENPPQSKTPQRGASASGTRASTCASVRSPGALGDNSDGGSRSAMVKSGGSDDKSNPTLKEAAAPPRLPMWSLPPPAPGSLSLPWNSTRSAFFFSKIGVGWAPPQYRRGACGDTKPGVASTGPASANVSRTSGEPLWWTAWTSVSGRPASTPNRGCEPRLAVDENCDSCGRAPPHLSWRPRRQFGCTCEHFECTLHRRRPSSRICS